MDIQNVNHVMQSSSDNKAYIIVETLDGYWINKLLKLWKRMACVQ
jgi:hypothetical protein